MPFEFFARFGAAACPCLHCHKLNYLMPENIRFYIGCTAFFCGKANAPVGAYDGQAFWGGVFGDLFFDYRIRFCACAGENYLEV